MRLPGSFEVIMLLAGDISISRCMLRLPSPHRQTTERIKAPVADVPGPRAEPPRHEKQESERSDNARPLTSPHYNIITVVAMLTRV